ncbi:PilW family protein [Halanaerobium salsuginis]|jgi:prepilin-type N-terminal cleavage/methylation domain-containing protein|uniref:Prepilin-type N-terminal cleavage/methylation domain-containing protein n=1 Tax=Halanaerobium salsuginis TaxID=29563 RepID=A0A1I4ETG2_9FIRM|nr:prepilin-type N-terminal cleavage/methylation domain-containing protein [Halanaerobium salsuginis]SFL08998.1 prepilin-type N-terminal cleavage/methylation domain-containing protein [Halanaerobium salsuginis]
MSLSHFCKKNSLDSKQGFSLIEVLVALVISTLIFSVFLQLILDIYQQNDIFNLSSSWQLDSYLALDFISQQIENSKQVKVVNENEINLFSYYRGQYCWLKFCPYTDLTGQLNLGRKLGSDNLNKQDFGKNLALIDDIKSFKITCLSNNLLKIELILGNKKHNLAVAKIINLN